MIVMKMEINKRASRKDNMKNKITMEEAIERILIAVEYYDMVHDTGEEEETDKNINYVWKGYDRLIEIEKKQQASEQKG